ncbi:MAG: type II toxin-antitoxin system ParD family antitoxin [Vicinamibacteria bacterium]|nr:type II toxin-antitoxin system ParD family antitoxin [Vicinamibacteria bacterium]
MSRWRTRRAIAPCPPPRTRSSVTVDGKVESGLYNNASEVIREGLRLLKEHDEINASSNADASAPGNYSTLNAAIG